MTREQQRKLKFLKQSLPGIIKNEIKKYKLLKKKDYMVWGSRDGMFFSMQIDIVERDGRCYCFAGEELKPLWVDDLFWDIIRMPENKSEPLSLRSIGAFTVRGVCAFESERELLEWEYEELEACVREYVEHFYHTVESSDMEDYDSRINRSAYHGELHELLALIHEGKRQEALDYIQTMEGEYFENEGKGFKKHARAYLKRNLLTKHP